MKRGIVAGGLAFVLLLAGIMLLWRWQKPEAQEEGNPVKADGEFAQSLGESARTEEMASGEVSITQGGLECVAIRVGQSGSDALAASGSGVVLEMSEDVLWVVTAGHVLERAGDENPVYVDFPNVQDFVKDMTAQHANYDMAAQRMDYDYAAERRTDYCLAEEQRTDYGFAVEQREDNDFVAVQCLDYAVVTEADLAFLRLEREELPEDVWQDLRAAEKDKDSYDALQASDKVYLSGYREGSLLVCEGILEEFWIYVEDFEQYMMLARCEVYSGMSGGGLYDGEGHLIGIVCGNNEQGEVAAVPLHVVESRFEDIRF
ncbi:MAG: serine protease [Butyrivibrio sp.]|nr:serine protease [Muribaculum sp.]MCM1553790.1 serine protease [Butyrivibrio sp.]